MPVASARPRKRKWGEASTVWPLLPHTAAKHRILESYLGGWFPVMAKWESKVIYFDAFSGPGRYSGGEDGSPLIALKVLLDHQLFPSWDATTFIFIFCDADSERTANLEEELDRLFAERPGGQPANVKCQVATSTFEAAAGEIIEAIGKQSLAPTFAFIDPFGWGGIPLGVIAQLLRFDKCEVFINFMADSLNRFITANNGPGVHTTLTELFGCEEFTQAPPSGPERHQFTLDLYKRQLGRHFKHIRSFEMVSNEKDRPLYHLVFGTRHVRGLSIMKSAMWQVDPERGLRFSASAADMPTLFSGEADVGPLKAALRTSFSKKTVTIEELVDWVDATTDYVAASHLKRKTLAPMETAGEIAVVTARKRRNTYPAGCQIRFP